MPSFLFCCAVLAIIQCGISFAASTEPNPLKKNECGVMGSGGKKYPWIASLEYKTRINIPRCTGTLITPRHILTGAHCFESGWEDVKVSFDHDQNDCKPISGDLEYLEKPDTRIPASKIEYHEKYDRQFDKFPFFGKLPLYDLAIVTLSTDVEHMPICLPEPGSSTKSVPGVFAEWRLNYAQFGPIITKCHLKQINVEKLTKDECRNATHGELEDPAMFCSSGACQRIDNKGGPFMTSKNDGRMVISGIGARKYVFDACSPEGYPNTYTDVEYLIDWIYEKIGATKIEKNSTRKA